MSPWRPIAVASACAAVLATAAVAQDRPAGQPPFLRSPIPDVLTPESAAPKPGRATSPDLAEPGAKAMPAAPGKGVRGQDPPNRETMLQELYAHLSTARSAEEAQPIAKTIETLWLRSESDTISLLMRRALKALREDDFDLALQFLDAVVDLSPDYAEGWSRRAYVYYRKNNYEHAVGDLRRALALEPNHYRALEGLGRILRESGQKKNALKVYRQLLRIHPFMPNAQAVFEELTIEVEGQRI